MPDTLGTLGFILASTAGSNIPTEPASNNIKSDVDGDENITLSASRTSIVETFNETTYQHTFTAGGEADINSIGGHSVLQDKAIVSADVVAVDITKNDTLKKSIAVPDAVRALPGYGLSAGDVYNEVDYANEQYIQRVAQVDMGTLDYLYNIGDAYFYTMSLLDRAYYDDNTNFFSTYFETSAESEPGHIEDKQMCGSSTDHTLYMKDAQYTDASAFRAAMSGQYLNYELHESIVTDISDLLSGEMQDIQVDNGTIATFKQSDSTKQIPVPIKGQTIIY